jgi:hypothetical protein
VVYQRELIIKDYERYLIMKQNKAEEYC